MSAPPSSMSPTKPKRRRGSPRKIDTEILPDRIEPGTLFATRSAPGFVCALLLTVDQITSCIGAASHWVRFERSALRRDRAMSNDGWLRFARWAHAHFEAPRTPVFEACRRAGSQDPASRL